MLGRTLMLLTNWFCTRIAASQTNSRAASTTCGAACCAFKCSAKTFGFGWPRFWWSFFKAVFSWFDRSRNLGPWISIGGGAQPSHICFDGSRKARQTGWAGLSGQGSPTFSAGTWISSDSGLFADKDSILPDASLRYPKLVIISLEGTAFRILWLLRRVNQSSQPKSWTVPELRWRHTVWRIRFLSRSGMLKGSWNLSVPRQT